MAAKQVVFMKPRTGMISASERESDIAKVRSHAAKHWRQQAKTKKAVKKHTSVDSTSEIKEAEPHRVRQAWPDPSSWICKGNSDPFASSTVAITPQINDIIRFFRFHYIPTVYLPYTFPARRPNAFQDLFCFGGAPVSVPTMVANALQHEVSARAFLLHMNNLMRYEVVDQASCNHLELQHRQALLPLLRSKIPLALTASDSDAILFAIRCVFFGAVYEGYLEEAIVHGTFLGKVLYQQWCENEQSLDLGSLLHLVHVDGQRAAKHLTQSIFDLEWTDNVLTRSLDQVGYWTDPQLPEVLDDLDPAIEDSNLRKWFIDFRKSTFLLDFEPGKFKEPLPIMRFVCKCACIVPGQMVNHYCQLRHQLSEGKDSFPEYYTCLIYAALILALLKQSSKPEYLVLFRDRGSGNSEQDKIMLSLQEIITKLYVVEPLVPSTLVERYQACHLWVLFIAAQAEQYAVLHPHNVTDNCVSEPEAPFFNLAFGDLARGMKLDSWPQVRSKLETILYCDFVQPHGSLWVEEVIRQETSLSLDQTDQIMDVPFADTS